MGDDGKLAKLEGCLRDLARGDRVLGTKIDWILRCLRKGDLHEFAAAILENDLLNQFVGVEVTGEQLAYVVSGSMTRSPEIMVVLGQTGLLKLLFDKGLRGREILDCIKPMNAVELRAFPAELRVRSVDDSVRVVMAGRVQMPGAAWKRIKQNWPDMEERFGQPKITWPDKDRPKGSGELEVG